MKNRTGLSPDNSCRRRGGKCHLSLHQVRRVRKGLQLHFTPLGSARCVFNKLIVFLLNVILFCFSQLIAEFGNITCADSTHNICQGENKVNIFPNTFDTRPCHRKGGSTCIHAHRMWITLQKQSLNPPGILSTFFKLSAYALPSLAWPHYQL